MTAEEFAENARKKCFVRWFPSGAVEYIYRGRKGGIYAMNVVTKDWHPIYPSKRREFFCERVDPNECVSLRSLLPPRPNRNIHP